MEFSFFLLRIWLSLAAVLAIGPTTPGGQIRQEQHARLRAALAADDLASVENQLREMGRSAPEAFARNNYDYLLARILMRRGNATEANRFLQQVVTRKSVLAGYALLHQAELARTSGNYPEEQRLLERLLSQHSGFLHREGAIQRLGASYLRTGKYQNVISTLSPLAGTRGATAREGLARIGEAQLALGQEAAARATFQSLLASGSLDDGSLRAITFLDRMDESAKTSIPERERVRRARIYQFNRSFVDARKHWLAVVNDYAQSTSRAEALFQLGRGYFLEENYTEAIRWYDRAHDQFPDTEEGEEGYYFAGHSYQALRDADRAIARYEAFLRAYPRSKYFGYAFLNAIDTLRSADRLDDALRWTARAQAEARQPFILTRALFDRVKIHLTQGNYAAALEELRTLRSHDLGVRGLVATTSFAEVAFLRALCLEQLGRFDEAITDYLALPEGRKESLGYYGFQASQRLRALGTNLRAKSLIATRLEAFLSQARAANAAGDAATAKAAASQVLRLTEDRETAAEMKRILRAAYSKLAAYKLPSFTLLSGGRTEVLEGESDSVRTVSDELLFLGLYDEGARELLSARAVERGPAARNWAYTLAVYCGRGDCPEQTLKFAEPILDPIPADYRLELMPRDLAEVFFPLSFHESFEAHAEPRGVDPRFILSIARQESRYDPSVKSPSAARGLLQFISSTGNQIAVQLNLRDFDQNDLYQPERAILIGSQYVKNLFEEFKTPQAAAAAYNGSEDSVRRWLGRARSTDVDRFVIEIAKRETKDYVFKVMGSYRAYQAIYPTLPIAKAR